MSTKIYTGFISKKPIKSPKVLLDASLAIQTALRPKSARIYQTNVAGFLTRLVDGKLAGVNNDPKPLYNQYTEHMFEVDIRLSKHERDSYWDTEVNWTLIPRKDGRVMGIMFADQYGLDKYWNRIRGKLGWEDYAYWNNSDEPEGMSYEAFKKRGDEWDEALRDGGVPSTSGFSMDLWSKYGAPFKHAGIEKDLRYQPSFNKRVADTAERVVRRQYEKRKPIAPGTPTDEVIGALMICSDWLKAPEGIAALDAEKVRLTSILPPRILKSHIVP